MDPFSAVVGAVIIATWVALGSRDAAADQARAEARVTRQAIIDGLRDRQASAARLRDRLEAGRADGPATAWWWAWAAVRTAGAVRRAARRARRPAEGARSRPTVPVRRILGAAWRGARHGWRRARAERADGQQRPAWIPVGVCERCGTIAATTALAAALTRHGRAALMCAACRAGEEAARQADQAGEATAAPDPEPGDVVDAELTGDPAAEADSTGITAGPLRCASCGEPLAEGGCTNPACRLSPSYPWPVGTVGASQEAATRWRLPVRNCPLCGGQLMPSTWWAVRATNADICLWCANGYFSSTRGRVPPQLPIGACRERTPAELAAIGDPVDDQDNPLPAGPGLYGPLGQLAAAEARAGAATSSPPHDPAGPREAAVTAPAPVPEGRDHMSCVTGEVHTQAAWADQASAISSQLAGVAGSTENMLASLSAVNAGREHIRVAAEWADQVRAVLGHGAGLIADVNRRQDPYVGAVQAAGGSAEVADPGYYREM